MDDATIAPRTARATTADATELNTVDNAITNVEVEELPDDTDGRCPTCGAVVCDHERPETGFFRVFVFAEDKRIKLAEFEGTDGNGYLRLGLVARGHEGE